MLVPLADNVNPLRSVPALSKWIDLTRRRRERAFRIGGKMKEEESVEGT